MPITDPFNNDIIRGNKALKSVSFVLSEFSHRPNIEPKLTTWHRKGEQLRNEQCIYDKS